MEIPQGSIYLWMYRQGLKGVPLDDILTACQRCGKQVRKKDVDNYNNGLRNHRDLAYSPLEFRYVPSEKEYFKLNYSDYPIMYEMSDVDKRWVPCSKENKPMIKWGQGCMSRSLAESTRGCEYLAENLLGTNMIVIDCDGDHDNNLDLETIEFLWQFSSITNVLRKPKDCVDYGCTITEFLDRPASFHLTFTVDRIIPTMHFPSAHIDIIGNKKNSLRYFKNKRSNLIPMAPMTDSIWSMIQGYIHSREAM